MRIVSITAIAVLALAALACSRRQTPDPNDPFRDVPDAQRESLRAAVKQMSEFQKSKQWEEMYEILEEPREPKDRFLRRRAEARSLSDFQPTWATWVPDGWVITGCAVYAPATNQPSALVSSLHAKLKDSRWSFTPIGIEVFPGEPGHVKTCSPSER